MCGITFIFKLKFFNNILQLLQKKKHAPVKINGKHYSYIAQAMCQKSIPMQVRQIQKAPHRTVDSCLGLCQYFPPSSAPAIPVLLILPQVDELLLWGYHHWQMKSEVLGPEADSAENFWNPVD